VQSANLFNLQSISGQRIWCFASMFSCIPLFPLLGPTPQAPGSRPSPSPLPPGMRHIKFSYILLNHCCGVVFKCYTLISPIGPRPSGPWGTSNFIYIHLIPLPPGMLHIKLSCILSRHSCGVVFKRYTLISRIGPHPSGPWETSTFIYKKIDSPSLRDASHQI